MRIITLNCNHCGAPLEVPAKTRYLTCSYCQAQLKVHHEGNAYFTEVLEKIEHTTDKIADDLETVKLQNELERIDREWIMRREQHMVKDKNGQSRVPSTAGSLIIGIFVILFGIFWTVTAASMGAPGIFPVFGLFFIALAVFGIFNGMAKASSYESNKRRYERQRHDLINRIRGS